MLPRKHTLRKRRPAMAAPQPPIRTSVAPDHAHSAPETCPGQHDLPNRHDGEKDQRLNRDAVHPPLEESRSRRQPDTFAGQAGEDIGHAKNDVRARQY